MPRLQVGDQVLYTGTVPSMKRIFVGGPLPIRRILRGMYANCTLPDGYITTWILLSDLRCTPAAPQPKTASCANIPSVYQSLHPRSLLIPC